MDWHNIYEILTAAFTSTQHDTHRRTAIFLRTVFLLRDKCTCFEFNAEQRNLENFVRENVYVIRTKWQDL